MKINNSKLRVTKSPYRKKLGFILIIAAVVLAGAGLLALSKATSRTVDLQPETAMQSNGANTVSDPSASGGQAVKFGSSNALLTELFTGVNGMFVDSSDFWGSSDLGYSKNNTWMSESGKMYRQNNAGTANNDYFRMWTRRTDMANVKMEMDMKFNGFFSGSEGWHGINVWLNESFCAPTGVSNPCNKVNDGNGPSGYAVDFMNRNGTLTILKKVKGDTRSKWPGAMSYSAGGTYYHLAGTSWMPAVGTTYKFAGQTIANGNGSVTIKLIINGQTKLQYTDSGQKGGPVLNGGRAGLRSDFANFIVDNIVISR